MLISENTPLGALIKTTLVDFPAHVACALFLTGCNLRCPYCYNGALVTGSEKAQNLASFGDVLQHLKKRRDVLSGFVISGGEALLHPALPELIKSAKALGYKIKLDTNGTLPLRLSALVSDSSTRPDFIAMDIKTAPARYGELLPQARPPADTTDAGSPAGAAPASQAERPTPSPAAAGTAPDYAARLAESIEFITREYAPGDREWRTVLVPPLVQKADIKAMAALLPPDASWQFASFRADNCLDSSYNSIAPYSDRAAAELVAYAKKLVPGAALR